MYTFILSMHFNRKRNTGEGQIVKKVIKNSDIFLLLMTLNLQLKLMRDVMKLMMVAIMIMGAVVVLKLLNHCCNNSVYNNKNNKRSILLKKKREDKQQKEK